MARWGMRGGVAVEVCVRRTAMAVLLASVGGWIGFSAVARAEGCSTNTEQVRQEEQVRVRSPLALLPDCRAYEQVSPVDKNAVDASGKAGVVEASPTGDGVTFFSLVPAIQAGSAELPSYLGVRSSGGGVHWSTQGLEAQVPPGSGESVAGVTSDLSKAIIEVGGPSQGGPSCEPTVVVCGGPVEVNAYVRNSATGTFQFLAELGAGHPLGLADATLGGSRILFETLAKLTPEAIPEVNNLYEWNEAKPFAERISLVGVLPGGAVPKEGSFAGPGGPATFRVEPRGEKWHFYTQHTLSEDGSRIFFSDRETGDIYMRMPQAEPAVTISISAGQAYWRGTTRDSSYVLYTEGAELYRFNVDRFLKSKEPEAKALTEAREQLTTGAEGVLGLLGNSEDGSYIYFAAPGELATATNENGYGEKAVSGEANLYEWHEGVLTFLTRLAKPEGTFADESDWREWTNETGEGQGPSGGEKASRLSFDGRYLLFGSTRKLTSYNNNGATEFYRYDAGQPLSSSNPLCVSCNPKGTPAIVNAYLTNANVNLTSTVNTRDSFTTHNLSSNGRRVFFETEEALLPGDANLQSDVYEWEANGEGSCESEAQNGGCLYLISTGQSPDRSYFGDANVDGNSVFFFTRQPLVSQDQDNNTDLYVAQVDGGIPGQNPPPAPAPCTQEEGCRGRSSNAPSLFGTPATATVERPGNLTPPPPPPMTAKGKLTNAQQLAKALKLCRKKHNRHKRTACERSARKRFRVRGSKSSQGHR